MDMNAVSGEFKVCLCKNITKDEVIAFVKSNSITSLKELREKMNVGNKCGGCAEDLESLIKMAYL